MKKNSMEDEAQKLVEGFQLKLDFSRKTEEAKPAYDLQKHFQHFPREKRLVEQE